MDPEPTSEPESAPVRERVSPSKTPAIGLLVIAAVAVGVRLYLMVSTRSTVEDFYITLRYAENLASGHGFVYNAGERVLGTTTPLYTLYLALCAWLGLDATVWGKLANILADGAGCWLLWRLGRAAGLGNLGLVGASLYALSPPNLTWAISGMETSLVTVCALALFVCAAERRLMLVAIVSYLLYMLRVDGLLAVTVVYVALFWSARRQKDGSAVFVSLAVFLTTCVPWTLYAWRYFGSPLPTSALAKLTVYAWMSKGAFPNVDPFVQQMTHTKLHLVLLAGAAIGALAMMARAPVLRPAILWMAAYYAAMAFSKGFLFGWYFVPPTPIYYLAAVAGWCWVFGIALRSRRSDGTASTSLGRAWAAPAIAVLMILIGLARLPIIRGEIYTNQQIEERLRKPIGLALKEMIRPGERLMLEPIGYIGYFSGARVLDAVGLVSPEVIPYFRKGAVSPYLDILHDLKPEWVLLRAGEYDDARHAAVPADRRLEASYRLVRTFSDRAAPADSAPAFYLFRRL
jgi:hypothetical protein